MNGIRGVILVLLSLGTGLGALLNAGSALAREQGERSRCRPSGAEVVASSASIVVSERRDLVVQACDLLTRRVTRLNRYPRNPFGESPTLADVLAVNDRYVAFGHHAPITYRGDDGSKVRFKVLDARRGVVMTSVAMYTGSLDPPSSIIGGSVPDVALTRDGSAAWFSTLRNRTCSSSGMPRGTRDDPC